MDFRNSTTWEFQLAGRQDAWNALNESGGLVTDEVLAQLMASSDEEPMLESK